MFENNGKTFDPNSDPLRLLDIDQQTLKTLKGITTMNIISIVELLKPLAAAGLNVGLTGQPGVGKTESIKAWAKTLKASDIRPDLAEPGDEDKPVRFISIACCTKESIDISGLMEIRDGVTKWSPPSWIPVGAAVSVVFLDEFFAAEIPVQLAFQRLIDKDLDGCEVAPRTMFIIAGNRPEDNCGVSAEIPQHIRNRCCWFNVESDTAAWRAWAEDNGVLKVIIDFIAYRPEMLNRFNPKSKDAAFATPRSVTRFSDVAKLARPEQWMMLAAGICGTAWSAEFMQFVRLHDSIPSIDEVLANAGTFKLPTDFGILNALTSAVIRAAKADKSRSSAVITLVERFYDTGQCELAAKMLRDCAAICPEIFANVATVKLFAKMQSMLSA